MLTTNPFDDDKLREECGVFGVSGADGAAALVALGLHALQHRGQEAAGITSWDGAHFHTHRAMGHVAGNFDRDEIIRALRGNVACGHVRYSTTGETALRNVQPLYAELATGGFAVAHNGNISNAMRLRDDLVRARLDLPVDQRYRDDHPPRRDQQLPHPLDKFIDALKQVEGAYSLIVMTPRGHDRLPRSARHPPAGDGRARRRVSSSPRKRSRSTWSARSSSARSIRASW